MARSKKIELIEPMKKAAKLSTDPVLRKDLQFDKQILSHVLLGSLSP